MQFDLTTYGKHYYLSFYRLKETYTTSIYFYLFFKGFELNVRFLGFTLVVSID